MTHSCADFTDNVLDALGVEVPEDAWYDPSAQADLARAAVEWLKRGDALDRELPEALRGLVGNPHPSRRPAEA